MCNGPVGFGACAAAFMPVLHHKKSVVMQ